MVTKKTLNYLNSRQLKTILNYYNISPDTSYDTGKLLQLLHFCVGFEAVFKHLKHEDVIAHFSQSGTLLKIQSKDGKTMLDCKQVSDNSKCTSCRKEVCNDNTVQGQGLECSSCDGWFHNQCHDSPLNGKLYGLLATSPSYLKALCPSCLISNTKMSAKIQALQTEFSGFKETLQAELIDIKKRIGLEHLKEHMDQVLDKESVQLHCKELCQEVSAITESTQEMRVNLNNTLMSVSDTADQMAQSVQRIDKLNTEELSSNITGLSKNVADLSDKIDHTVGKLSSDLVSVSKPFSALDQPDLSSPNVNTNNMTISTGNTNMVSANCNPVSQTTQNPKLYSDITQRPCAQIPSKKPSTNYELPESRQKLLCDESKTIAIENITNYHKFVRHSKDTKKEFNTHFNRVKIIHSKGTRRGTLLIELESEEIAESVVQNWKAACFSNDNGVTNKTKATLLKNKNCKGIIYNIDHDYEEDFIVDEIRKTDIKSDVSVRRFKKGGKKMSTVMITFGLKEDLEYAIKNGLTIGRSPEDVHPYKPVPTVVQCFNCFKFDHTKVWCPKRTKCCQYCSQIHDPADCLIHQSGDTSQYKCVNCNEGQHDSLSRECSAYKEKLAQAIQYFDL